MEKYVNNLGLNGQDALFIEALKGRDNNLCRQFFYQEIIGILHKIRTEVFGAQVDLDEMVNELYLYLSADNWAKLDSFDGRNGCRLRTWMIVVAWRLFMSIRERLLSNHTATDTAEQIRVTSNEDMRIQIAIDVNAVLERMPNRRYAEILRLLIIEGYGAQQVADMLALKVENVYNLKHRAIAQFVKFYGR